MKLIGKSSADVVLTTTTSSTPALRSRYVHPQQQQQRLIHNHDNERTANGVKFFNFSNYYVRPLSTYFKNRNGYRHNVATIKGIYVLLFVSLSIIIFLLILAVRNGRRSLPSSIRSTHLLMNDDTIIPNRIRKETKDLMIDYDYDTTTNLQQQYRISDPINIVPYTHHHFVILVLSHRNHWNRRSKIRQTWGKVYNNSLLFLIGGSHGLNETIGNNNNNNNNNNNGEMLRQEHQLLVEEQSMYNDLLDTIHPESYRSLPHKLRYGIHWLVTEMSKQNKELQWILKVDDDMFVRNILVPINESASSTKIVNPITRKLVLGCIQYHIPIQRHGKWAEEETITSLVLNNIPIYPPWPKGSCGYLLSYAVARVIAEYYSNDLKQQQQPIVQIDSGKKQRRKHNPVLLLPSLQGEDTSFGIWLRKLNVSWITSPHFMNDGNCMPNQKQVNYNVKPKEGIRVVTPWVIGHKMTLEQIQHCYDIESKTKNQRYDSSPFDDLQTANTLHEDPIHHPNSSAYHIAMQHQEMDQILLQQSKLSKERSDQRAHKRQQYLFRDKKSGKLNA